MSSQYLVTSDIHWVRQTDSNVSTRGEYAKIANEAASRFRFQKIKNTATSPDRFEHSVSTAMGALLDELATYSTVAANKLSLGVTQFSKAHSVQEYQQIGICVRDSWIEFAQSIFRSEFCPVGQQAPGRADVKKMIEYTLRSLDHKSDYLVSSSKSAYDLANGLQHDLSATRQAALWCLYSTILDMLLILDLAASSEVKVKSPYYKCPYCSSINLEVREHWEVEYDGAWKCDKLVCADCGWYYIEDLGGMTGIE